MSNRTDNYVNNINNNNCYYNNWFYNNDDRGKG